MARRNHSFASDPQPYPTVHGFNPGGDDFGVIRMIDGHAPYEGGIAGSNVHQPSSPDHSFGPGTAEPAGEAQDYDDVLDDE